MRRNPCEPTPIQATVNLSLGLGLGTARPNAQRGTMSDAVDNPAVERKSRRLGKYLSASRATCGRTHNYSSNVNFLCCLRLTGKGRVGAIAIALNPPFAKNAKDGPVGGDKPKALPASRLL
jgi:hypothetical protein